MFIVLVDPPTTIHLQHTHTHTHTQAIRVLVSSSEAVSAHPLLVTVRQPRAISSWALPYVESGY